MLGVEKSHLNAAISAALKAYYDFLHSAVGDSLRSITSYGKKDTLGMDAGPEITICQELRNYDSGAVVITEEIGSKGRILNDSFRSNDPQLSRTVFICDPTDRSKQLHEFLQKFPEEMPIGDIFSDPSSKAKWEVEFGAPASITGATSAISCIRRGIPIFAVIVNYVTQELIISCAAGNKILNLPSERPGSIELNTVLSHGSNISFEKIDGKIGSMQKFVTFMGDSKKTGYKENIEACEIMSESQLKSYIHYGSPGGPSRSLYLSSLQTKTDPIGFVFGNGEKIGEWIHWLPFVRFARSSEDDSQPALILFEVFHDQPRTKEGILMSTPLNYSIFQEHDQKLFMDTNALLRMINPSQYRSTLILAPYDNRWAMRASSQSGYRHLVF